jgi:hypothetical protein
MVGFIIVILAVLAMLVLMFFAYKHPARGQMPPESGRGAEW